MNKEAARERLEAMRGEMEALEAIINAPEDDGFEYFENGEDPRLPVGTPIEWPDGEWKHDTYLCHDSGLSNNFYCKKYAYNKIRVRKSDIYNPGEKAVWQMVEIHRKNPAFCFGYHKTPEKEYPGYYLVITKNGSMTNVANVRIINTVYPE